MTIAVHLAWRLRLGREAPESVLVSKVCKMPALVKPIVLLPTVANGKPFGVGKGFRK